eukprot:m.133632 g.133632  ORF g.133632 m.133632 type:complete len:76 (+) comp15953_c0_seq19:561-788(+)
MREYVTRQSRDAVQQFANFLTLHSEESPLFAVVQSLLVSNELLQVIFNLDTLLTTPDGCTFFHRRRSNPSNRLLA